MIFGSTAARHWFSDFREPKDIDILAQQGEFTKEVQTYWYGASSQYIVDNNPHHQYVCPVFLYTIKAAHSNWDIFWEKTVADIAFFQRKGVELNHTLYELLMKDFIILHGKRWASLEKKDNMNFFKDAVTRKYVHDTIHEAVAYYDEPLYERIVKEKGKVSCSLEKFKQLTHEDQLRLVKEEVFVTALERYLIPNDFKYSTQRAYYQSLKKLITTMSSNWFSKFIIENFTLLYRNTDNYVEKFNQNQHKLQLCLKTNKL